jgi:peptidoglycan/xylan/chitin deacetylase (PgdA/CDA1 family)
MSKTVWKNITYNAAEFCGLIDLLQKAGQGNGQYLYVLVYHRVEEFNSVPWLDQNYISTTPQNFEDQMRLVAKKYHPVTTEEVLEAVREGSPLPKDAVLITVDDGYRCFLDVIFPICNRYGIQPLLFQPTGFVGSGTFWWDKVYQIIHLSGQNEIETPIGQLSMPTKEEKYKVQRQLIQALKKMPFHLVTTWIDSTHTSLVNLSEEQQHNTLTWDELRQLNQAGVSIASHTHTHPIMTQISLEEAHQQILLSQEIIQRELKKAMPIFAFPDGKPYAYNTALIDMLYTEGFEMIFLMINGRAMIQPGVHKITLPRLAVWKNQTLPRFHIRLTPLKDRP